MSRKTATAAVQPDLLGGHQPQPGPKPKTPTTDSGVQKSKVETVTKPKAKQGEVAKPAVNKGHLTVVKNTPASSISVIVDLLKDPKLKPESARLAFDMHKELLLEQRRLDFIVAKREMKQKLPVINKDGKIEYRDKGDGKGKPKPLHFASYPNLHDACAPALYEFGFDVTHVAQPGATGFMNVVTSLVHVNGHEVQSVLPMPHDGSGGKSGAQGWHSAFSFGKRVNMIGLLDIVTREVGARDVDGSKVKHKKNGEPQTIDGNVVVESEDGHTGVATVEVCSEDQLAKVREAIEANGVPDKVFLNHFKIEKVSQLPVSEFEDALVSCKNYGAKKRGQ